VSKGTSVHHRTKHLLTTHLTGIIDVREQGGGYDRAAALPAGKFASATRDRLIDPPFYAFGGSQVDYRANLCVCIVWIAVREAAYHSLETRLDFCHTATFHQQGLDGCAYLPGFAVTGAHDFGACDIQVGIRADDREGDATQLHLSSTQSHPVLNVETYLSTSSERKEANSRFFDEPSRHC